MRLEPPSVRARSALLPPALFALIAALVAGGWGPLHTLDRTVTARLHEAAHAGPALTTAMTWLTNLFQPNVFRLAALILVIWLLRKGARRTAAWVATTMIAGGLLGALLKLVFLRDRPDFPDPVSSAAGYAFPSGHALNAVLGVAVFVMIFPRLWALWVIPPVTALTRVHLGVHWTSDVVAGLLLGVAVVLASRWAFFRYGHEKSPVHPATHAEHRTVQRPPGRMRPSPATAPPRAHRPPEPAPED
ncbi:phosphatase PAP2 family protein [Actinoplanes sp. G11-F43]|uniref:phosphatase PAP2 family protein n=1 Tax=Actinoplanes sp. G11-F43 TaxID=3424130 RepID=UPI003D353FB6